MEPAVAIEQTLDPTAMAVWLERYIGVWNAHDVDGIAALYTDDVVYSDPGHPRVMHGQAEVRGFLRGVFAALPDFTVTPAGPICVTPAAPQALATYTFSGTMLGDWPDLGLAATGSRMSGAGVSNWEFRHELVYAYSTYYDTLGMVRQLGVLPRSDSALDRALRPMQHLQARAQRRLNARRQFTEVSDA
jgi:steroid delta-isomerase-like uncharacterized protein